VLCDIFAQCTWVWFCFWCLLLLCSCGTRGHIPYRDSKLTRILQSSLGGNARTAIVCTVSPALSHVEQTRNTLSFATRAKEVVNTARVNMVWLTPRHDIYEKSCLHFLLYYVYSYFSRKHVLIEVCKSLIVDILIFLTSMILNLSSRDGSSHWIYIVSSHPQID
jgi:hypothetical protein